METVFLAGDGWGAISAFNSLTKIFGIEIKVVTSDDNFIKLIEKTNNAQLHNKLEGLRNQLVVCAGYKSIVPKTLLINNTFINIHYSLLPKYRGLHSTVWAILNNEDYLGLTIHRMNEFIDDGPIIYQYKIANDYTSSSKYYMLLFNEWVENNLYKIITRYMRGNLNEIKQDKLQATWVGKRNKEDCKINFYYSHKFIYNMFRALVKPYPLPFIRMKKSKEEFEIKDFKLIERKINTHIGRILNIDDEGVYVSSKDGYVILKSIIDKNKETVPYSKFKIGSYLDT